jgi:hypothetical protein
MSWQKEKKKTFFDVEEYGTARRFWLNDFEWVYEISSTRVKLQF